MHSQKITDDITLRPLLDLSELEAAASTELRALARYAGQDTACFTAWKQGKIAAACWFWFGETYQRRNFWPLAERDAKLVQITVGPEFQGQGIGKQLLRYAAEAMREREFERLFARIWHSNVASIKAFEAAGWENIAFVAELHPVLFPKPIRLQWTKRTSIKEK